MNNFLFSKIIIRTPTFPIEFFSRILLLDNASRLKVLKNNTAFMHALYIASPSLFGKVLNSNNLNEREKLSMHKSLLKYAGRSATRPIPFGLFAGIGCIDSEVSNASKNINIIDLQQHTRLDAQVALLFSNAISTDLKYLALFKYYSNPSLYGLGKFYRYIECNILNNNNLNYSLVQVEKNRYLNKLIRISDKGIHNNTLILLLKKEGFPEEEAIEYLNDLLRNKVLIPTLEPSIIGTSMENTMVKHFSVLNGKSHGNETISFLNTCIRHFDHIDREPIESTLETTQSISRFVQQFDKQAEKNKTVLHKELHIKYKGGFTQQQHQLIQKGIRALKVLSTRYNEGAKTKLDLFKEAFYEKYENASIPLLTALDPDTGIGYGEFTPSGSQLINAFPHQSQQAKTVSLSIDTIDSFLIRKFEEARANNQGTISVQEKEMSFLSERDKVECKFPTGVARFSLYKDNNKKDKLWMQSIADTSPCKVMGRFTLANKEIADLVKEIANYEKMYFDQENTIVAEIDHQPNAALSNVLYRKNFRDYRLLLTNPPQDLTENIPINDLILSVKGNRLVLTSKTLKKNVLPVFSNAFNTNAPFCMPQFKFLLDFSTQWESKMSGMIDVLKYHNFFLFLPRIEYDNIILSKASWLIRIKDFFEKDQCLPQAQINFGSNCLKLQLPEQFLVVEGDRKLLIDQRSKDLIAIFLDALKTKKKLYVEEYLLTSYHSIVNRDNRKDHYNHEFFMPYQNKSLFPKLKVEKIKLKKTRLKRSFAPGSEWVYFKIYVAVHQGEQLLSAISRLLQHYEKNNIIKLFFFVPFKDNDHHIRLRILLEDPKYFGQVVGVFNNTFSKKLASLIHKTELSTYQRELERYGGKDMENFEKLFHVDSKFVIYLLGLIQKNKVQTEKWLLSLLVIEVYMQSFALSMDEQIQFAKSMELYFSDEFEANQNTHKYINQTYNTYKDSIVNAFQKNTTDLKTKINWKNFRAQVAKGTDFLQRYSKVERQHFLQSVIHMHTIRMQGASSNRLYEYLMYAFYRKLLYNLKSQNLAKHCLRSHPISSGSRSH